MSKNGTAALSQVYHQGGFDQEHHNYSWFKALKNWHVTEEQPWLFGLCGFLFRSATQDSLLRILLSIDELQVRFSCDLLHFISVALHV